MNQAIELHDSVLMRVVQSGTTVRIDLRAMVHESSDEPGAGASEVWVQQAEIVMMGVLSHLAVPDTEQRICDGALTIGNRVEDNLIPLPAYHNDHVELALELADGSTLSVAGTTIRIELGSSRKYLEKFSGM